jgi:hypothetical protein
MPEDAFDMHFYDLLGAKKIHEARAHLNARAERGQEDVVSFARRFASLLRVEGKELEAVATLTKVIDAGQDRTRSCQLSRANLYFNLGDMVKAEEDYLAVLADQHWILRRSFHSFAAFRIAWIRALRGDPSYRSFLDEYPDEKEGFVGDRIATRADVDAMYEQRKAQTSRKVD